VKDYLFYQLNAGFVVLEFQKRTFCRLVADTPNLSFNEAKNI